VKRERSVEGRENGKDEERWERRAEARGTEEMKRPEGVPQAFFIGDPRSGRG